MFTLISTLIRTVDKGHLLPRDEEDKVWAHVTNGLDAFCHFYLLGVILVGASKTNQTPYWCRVVLLITGLIALHLGWSALIEA